MELSTNVRCELSGETVPIDSAIATRFLSPHLIQSIKEVRPDWDAEGYVCIAEVNKLGTKLINSRIREEMGQLFKAEEEARSAGFDQGNLLTSSLGLEYGTESTLASRISDKMAEVGGSWAFIITFGIIMAVWIVINTGVLLAKPFDPYPYILLNLFLSCVAAIQAPIIMMSQNRQESKDRRRGQNDYLINLKSELEVRFLGEKVTTTLYGIQHNLLQIDILSQRIDRLSSQIEKNSTKDTEK